MQGILLIDKPIGWTSFDVVAYVRSVIYKEEGKSKGKVKVGHSGTLDPMATGLLILLIGKEYTAQANKYIKLDKVYEVEMKLGQVSDSGDSEGNITDFSDYVPPEKEVKGVLAEFEGEISQVPPQLSAIKVGGMAAYKLARRGKKVELQPRKVNIYSLKLKGYKYPIISFDSYVSSGTYIRSLVYDMGLMLKSGAYVTVLRRTSIGDISIDKALMPDTLTYDKIAASLIEGL